MHPFGELRLHGRHDKVEMILHQNIAVHLDPVAPSSFGQITQKLQSILVISEDLFPSVSTRHDLVERTGKSNPWKAVTSVSVVRVLS